MATPSLKGPRIRLYDIETSHNLVATFRLFGEDYIPHTNLLQERYIICGSWKDLGEDKVYSVAVTDDPKRFKKDPNDDTYVVKKLHEALGEADVLVAHNGDMFDHKYIRARGIFHGLAPMPPVTTIDTLKIARSEFLFNSNRLDYLGQYLGVGRKIETKPGLWLDVLRGDAKAVKEMVGYNQGDVRLLEAVFRKMQPYIPDHVNRELFGGASNECPRCGSSHLQARGLHHALTQVYQRWQCQGCGGWFRTAKAERGRAARLRAL